MSRSIHVESLLPSFSFLFPELSTPETSRQHFTDGRSKISASLKC